jgi:glycosyltransferase involved in cell wall biosynthesis
MLTVSSENCEVGNHATVRRPMKIAFVAPLLAKNATGLSSYLVDLVPRLCDAGHGVTVLGSDCGYQGQDAGELISLDPRVDLKIFPVRGKVDRRLYRSSEMTRWLRKHARTFDVADIQGVWSCIAADAATECKSAGVPYIITPHGMMTRWDWAKQRIAKEIFFNLNFRRTWINASAIRYLSEGELKNSRVFPKSSHVIIPNAVASPPPTNPGEARRVVCERYSLPSDSRIILFLGRVTDQKGVLELLSAFEFVRSQKPEVHLVIAGPADGPYGEMVRERANSISDRAVHVIGPVYGDSKNELLSSATIFVTLSKNEGLPIAALEALSIGVPVVVTKESNLPEVELANAGVVTTCDSQRAASDINALLGDAERMKNMRRNAIELADTKFSWSAVFPRLENLYEQVARSHEFQTLDAEAD